MSFITHLRVVLTSLYHASAFCLADSISQSAGHAYQCGTIECLRSQPLTAESKSALLFNAGSAISISLNNNSLRIGEYMKSPIRNLILCSLIMTATGCILETDPEIGMEKEEQEISALDAKPSPSELRILATHVPKPISYLNLFGARGSWKDYWLQAPTGTRSVYAIMQGGSGDADLYVKRGAFPLLNDYDCRPYLIGNNETCNMQNLNGNVWFISIYGYTDYNVGAISIGWNY